MSETSLSILFAQNIAQQRKRLGLSQKELAIRLDITQEAMVRIERSKTAETNGRNDRGTET